MENLEWKGNVQKTLHFFATLKDIPTSVGRKPKELLKISYYENLISATIINAFAYKSNYKAKELYEFVLINSPKEVFSELPADVVMGYLFKLCNIGLISQSDYDNTTNYEEITYSITTEGLRALQQQTFSQLAQSALYNSIALRVNQNVLLLNGLAILLAIGGLIVSLIIRC